MNFKVKKYADIKKQCWEGFLNNYKPIQWNPSITDTFLFLFLFIVM